jgi:hypothetical protein
MFRTISLLNFLYNEWLHSNCCSGQEGCFKDDMKGISLPMILEDASICSDVIVEEVVDKVSHEAILADG